MSRISTSKMKAISFSSFFLLLLTSSHSGDDFYRTKKGIFNINQIVLCVCVWEEISYIFTCYTRKELRTLIIWHEILSEKTSLNHKFYIFFLLFCARSTVKVTLAFLFHALFLILSSLTWCLLLRKIVDINKNTYQKMRSGWKWNLLFNFIAFENGVKKWVILRCVGLVHDKWDWNFHEEYFKDAY